MSRALHLLMRAVAAVTPPPSPGNTPPVAVDNAYSTAFETPLVVNASGVLGNDTDADLDTLTAGSASDPAHGSVSLSADGSFTYTPDTGWSGADTFTYVVSDGQGGTDTGTVTVTTGSAPPSGDWPTFNTSGLAGYGGSLTEMAGGTITVDNTTITGKRITNTVDVQANGVTFDHCSIESAASIAIAVQAGKSNITFVDCDIVSGGFITAISGTTFLRCRMDPSLGHRADDLVLAWSSVGHNGDTVLIEDCFFGALWGFGPAEDPDHVDCFQTFGFGTVDGLTIRHNYFDSTNVSGEPGSVANGAGVFVADGTYTNVTVEYNFFDRTDDTAGYYHLRLASDSPSSGHVIRGNRFAQQGTVGPYTLFQMDVAEWSDNLYYPSLDSIDNPMLLPPVVVDYAPRSRINDLALYLPEEP